MEQITNLSVDILKVHPRNTEFFDDIQGEQYEKFKNSIKEDGILTPLIVSPDMTIISGHQRYQAAKDLNIGLVPVIIKEELLDEDEKLKKLLATNFGRLDNNEMKQSRVIVTYEELCNIKKGNNQYSIGHNVRSTQSQIAKELGISIRQLRRLKDLQKLIPELQDMVENNELGATTGYMIYAKMSKEEQEKFFNEIGKDKIKELTQKATKELIEEKRKLEQALVEEKNKPPKVVTEVVDKTDYSEINKLREEKRDLQMKCMKLKNKVEKSDEEDLKREIENLKYLIKNKDKEIREMEEIKKELNENRKLVAKFTGESTNLELISTTSKNKKRMMDFLDEMSKYDYLAETFNEIPRATRNEWLKGVRAIYRWATNILNVVDGVESTIDNDLVIDTNFEIEMK